MLRPLAGLFQAKDYPEMLVGLGAPDDAAVYRLSPEQAIISTVDFFPPVVDDPYSFGAAAAANALSDIYAMGGRPILAINLAAFPEDMPQEVMGEILRGGAEKLREAGAALGGGHTITDREPKFGMAVTGLVHPDRIVTKGGAKAGDQLVLTKALGTGVITTAHKRDLVEADELSATVDSMTRLNRAASEAALAAGGVHAMTDVTGFGLLGHAHEMAHLSETAFALELKALAWLPGARRLAEAMVFPGGTERNVDYFGRWVSTAKGLELPDWEVRLLHDPQTSGGLLMAIEPDHADELVRRLQEAGEIARIVGTVMAGAGEIHVR